MNVNVTLLTTTALLATTTELPRPLSLAKLLHRFSPALTHDYFCITKRAGFINAELHTEIEYVGSDFLACARSGLLLPSRKISISKVHPAFNEMVQANLIICQVRGRRHVVLHIFDVARRTSKRSQCLICLQCLWRPIERVWIIRHCAQRSFASDD